MITITCTNCQTSLTMDEAFAGGVCRCQHCGTIQTVPKSARAGVVSGAAVPGGSKALWKQKTASDTQAGTGLDELADIVASSGLAGSGLQSGGLRKKTPPPSAAKPATKKVVPVLAGAGAAVVVLAIVLVFVLMNQKEPAVPSGPQPGVTAGGVEPAAVKIAGPSFANVKLSGASTVAYVLDRGSGTQNVFGDLREITLKSIASLGADRKFQVIFWEKGGEVITYPASGTTVGGETSIGEATRKLEEVNAFGSTNIAPAIKKASAVSPDTIVLATGKGADLDESFREEVKANRPAGAKIHTISLGESDSPVLKAIAAETGGEYKRLSTAELNALR